MPTFNCHKCPDICQDMKEVMRNCAGDSPFILAEATESRAPSGQAEFDLLSAGHGLNGVFRSIISHRMMGYDCDMDKDEFDEMIDDLVKAAMQGT